MNAKTTEKLLQFAACFMIELMLFVPFYISDVFAQEDESPVQVSDTTPPFINVTIPPVYNKHKMHIEGTTEPFANLKLYIDGVYERQIGPDTTGTTGKFVFRDVQLNNLQTNTLNIIAEDMAGNINEAAAVVYVDANPPNVSISEIPGFTTEESLLVNGTVDEWVHIDFYVKAEKEEAAEPPSAVQSVHVDPESLSPNSLTLAWIDKPPEEEITEYLIYRSDVGLIATISSTPFTDLLVSTNTSYKYQVSALNKYCIEGPKTEVSVTTPLGGTARDIVPEKIEHECETDKPQSSIDTDTERFQHHLDLFAGSNNILINVSDIANNSVSFSGTTYVDTEPPEISGLNINEISPSYIRDVTIKGKVSENATVHVYVNNKTSPEKSVRTAEDGTFSAEIKLERTISLETYEKTGAQVVTGEAGRAWINYINVTAVDDSGQAASKTGQAIYALCGEGADWDIDISEITPDILLPRFILEGIGQIGFDAKLKWQGPGEKGSISSVSLERMPLSPKMKEKSDLDWIGSIPAPIHDIDYRNMYFILKLKVPGQVSGNTTVEQENNLSEHRIGECTIPEMGCLKIPVILRIDYSYYDPYNRSDVSRTQKHCMDIKIMIDRRIPPDKIPKTFLLKSIDYLNTTINLIDQVLKPVKTARKWVFLACAGSWVLWWMKRAGEWMSCIGAKNLEICNPEGDDEDAEKCADCLKAKSSTIALWIKSQWLCDRIMCPPAPTVQKYIQDARDGDLARSHCSVQEGDIKYNIISTDKTGFDKFMDPENMNLYVRPGANGAAGTPNPEYCEYEYYMNYNSVAYFMNELEESYCVTNPSKEQMETNEFAKGIDCGGAGKVMRVVGGICTKQESQNMTLSVVGDDRKTHYYYIEQDDKQNIRTAKNAERKRQIITETVDGRTVKRDVEIFEPQEPAILSSKDCVTEGKTISYADFDKNNKDNIPEEVWHAVCQPPKEYVVDPTSGLITAFRSVCLTAMAGYLQHWRTILTMVRNCLQTIVYTGDGSAGVCKQVLTIYLCDLIYFAIKCVIERASAAQGYSKEREVGKGIGGFLSYMQDSSAQMQQGIRGRYGSSTVYRTLFVEKKLIHSICAFAFTGDWNLDLDAFLEEEVTIPIETSCFATGTRRFLTKNPAQHGWANFMYHMGIFVVSGASDLRYRVELVCSGDNTCGKDIDSQGVCDCLKNKKTAQTQSIVAGPGHLDQGEVVDEEVFLPITQGFRYDKIRILISYTDANNNRIENKLCGESTIMEVGGSPPADCSFDIMDLSYHCEFEWGEHGYAKFKDTPKFTGDKTEFFNGDKLYIDGEIEKFEKSSKVNERMALWYKIYRKGQSNTFYKNTYIEFSMSNPKIMDLFASPLQISSTAVNEVKSAKSFEFNPFVDITQQTGLRIEGGVDPIKVQITPEMVMDDVIDLEPIEIIISKGGSLIDSGKCIAIPNTKLEEGGVFKCEITGTKNKYTVTVSMRGDKKPKDIGKEMTVKIFPPKTQTGSVSEVVDMVLELSLHYIDSETQIVNPSPIDIEGVRQTKTIEFKAHSSKAAVARRAGACINYAGRNPNTNPCYCDPIAAEHDCGTDDKKQYCYQNNVNSWICVEYPKCGSGENTAKCDCDLDGVYTGEIDCDGTTKQYCYLGECHAEPQNFAPDLQEVKYYTNSGRNYEYTGVLTEGTSVYVVLKFYDLEGVKSASFAGTSLTEIPELKSGDISYWGELIKIPDATGIAKIKATDEKEKSETTEIELVVGSAAVTTVPTVSYTRTTNINDLTPDMGKYAVEQAKANGIDPVMFFALLRTESNFDEDIVSPKGAVGIAQFMSDTAKDYFPNKNVPDKRTDIKSSIDASTSYLKDIITRNQRYQNGFTKDGIFYSQEDLVAMSYNAGETRINDWINNLGNDLTQETYDYSGKIKANKEFVRQSLVG